jgi:hypothetical protein
MRIARAMARRIWWWLAVPLGACVLFVLAIFVALWMSPPLPRTITSAAAATAYTDGFEVVVRDGQVGAFLLEEAEARLARPGATALLVDADATAKDLEAKKRGGSRYPFVSLKVSTRDGGWQEVSLSFHYSARTFYYDYATDGRRVKPILSGHRDLSGDRRVVYNAK